jgi:hypothetical protein
MPPRAPSRQVLDEVPLRVFVFLRAIGTSVVLRGILAENGYRAEDHREGWDLLLRAVRWDAEPRPLPVDSNPARDAGNEVEAWARKDLVRARAALRRLHPTTAASLAPKRPIHPILEVIEFLSGIDALETGKGGRKKDLPAIRTLTARGIDRAERRRVFALATKALTPPKPEPGEPEPEAERSSAVDKDVDVVALRKLHGWWVEWSAVARAAIRRRDLLARLGLGGRRLHRPAGLRKGKRRAGAAKGGDAPA